MATAIIQCASCGHKIEFNLKAFHFRGYNLRINQPVYHHCPCCGKKESYVIDIDKSPEDNMVPSDPIKRTRLYVQCNQCQDRHATIVHGDGIGSGVTCFCNICGETTQHNILKGPPHSKEPYMVWQSDNRRIIRTVQEDGKIAFVGEKKKTDSLGNDYWWDFVHILDPTGEPRTGDIVIIWDLLISLPPLPQEEV